MNWLYLPPLVTSWVSSVTAAWQACWQLGNLRDHQPKSQGRHCSLVNYHVSQWSLLANVGWHQIVVLNLNILKQLVVTMSWIFQPCQTYKKSLLAELQSSRMMFKSGPGRLWNPSATGGKGETLYLLGLCRWQRRLREGSGRGPWGSCRYTQLVLSIDPNLGIYSMGISGS